MLNLSEAQAIIQKETNRLRFEKEPEGLYEPLNYMLSLGGKRLRPALMLMLSSIYQDEIKSIIPYAIGIELFHNFTLIHDDI
ncbi:MAG: polyprenyl synthetase family protein, partial [Bacteroidota bacterium]